MVTEMMSKTTIARPAEEVFGFFLALEEKAPETHPGVKSVAKSPAGAADAGTTVQFRQKTLGWTRQTTMRFIAVEANCRIEFEESGPLTKLRATITFDRTDGETTVVFRGQTFPVGRLKSISPLLTLQVQRSWEQRLARIKTALEASAP